MPVSNSQSQLEHAGPEVLPITTEQYETLVNAGTFEGMTGQIELIHGRILHMNPQGPEHADPIDFLTEWSVESALRRFTIRVEKPIRIPSCHSIPEPDIAWATRQRYYKQHPGPEDIHLLIEVSRTSSSFDRTEKMQLYAEAQIPDYWQVDVPNRIVTLHREPQAGTFRSIQTFDVTQTIHPLCLPETGLFVKNLFATQ